MQRIVLATNNKDKIREIGEIIGSSYELIAAREIDPNVDWDETGKTFRENALIKAQVVKNILQENEQAPSGILAEDSGLCVEALNGDPGIYSARYAGLDCNHKANNEKLLKNMVDVPQEKRHAYYICSLVFIDEKGKEHHFEGRCLGTIGDTQKGEQGFGYDPVFIPDGQVKTMAELGVSFKNTISHRLEAIGKWSKFLRSQRP